MIICSPQLGLSPNSALGGEVFDREILLGLAEKGVMIQIILPYGKSAGKIPKNWKIHRIFITHFPALLFNFLLIGPLFKINRQKKISIIRLHQPQFTGIGSLVFKFFNRHTKIIATYHQFKETKFWFLSKKINNAWDHIICDSENVKQKITNEYKVPQQKITVVHNGVPKYLEPSSKDKKLERSLDLQNKAVLLFMGSLIERKNPLFLLDVILKIKEKFPGIVLIYWGEGPQKGAIIKRAQSMGLSENIRMQKPLFGPGKNLIHNLADIFVLPSLDEGFALAPLEAMTCGKPVILNKSHSASEAVSNGQNGYLCMPNNRNDWARKIIKILKNKRLRKKMEEAARQKALKEFQWGISVEKHLDVLKSLNS